MHFAAAVDISLQGRFETDAKQSKEIKSGLVWSTSRCKNNKKFTW